MLTGLHTTLRNALTDVRFSWFPRGVSGDIVIVAIDSPSLKKIGVWPWPRGLHAKLIEKLMATGASNIMFDVDFSSASDPESDQEFASALKRAGGSVVLPSFKQLAADRGYGKITYVNRPLPQFSERAWSALVNVAPDEDGLVRRYSLGEILGESYLPSMAALLAGKYDTKLAAFLIDFSIKAKSIPSVSYVDVLNGDSEALSKINGKKVLIGGTALELGDRFNAPNGQIISGVVLQALAAESILQGRMLHVPSDLITWSGLFVLAVLMIVAWRRPSVKLRVAIPIGFAALAEFGAVICQIKFPLVVDTSLFHVAVASYIVAVALDEIDFRGLLGKIAENRFERIAMSLGDGLVCTDRNGVITIWNPGATAIFGYESKEMIGQAFDHISASTTFSLLGLPTAGLQAVGGTTIEMKGLRKNGDKFPLEACFSRWRGADGFQYGAVLRDVSVRKRELERIRYLAEYDILTGVANRVTLHQFLTEKLIEAQINHSEVALLTIGLDKFKEINDRHGSACGDQVLFAAAKRLSDLIDGTGLVARLGGDEFGIVVSGFNLAEKAENLCERILVAFGKIALSIGAPQLRIGCSAGVAIYPKDCNSVDELLGNADLALHRAKTTGRGKYTFFSQELRDELEARLAMEVELERAMELGQFELFYQPQVSLVDGRLVGAEALIRWRHPDRGLIPPAEFMSVVNGSPLSDDVAYWVLQTACHQGFLWQQKGYAIRVGVNLSPSQLQSDDLATIVTSVLQKTGFFPQLLELEITEDILLHDDEKALDIFHQIQDLGVNIAFDDFGTGFASLSYLKKFSFDRLKIDRSFVRELRADTDDAAIVASTISLGRSLGLAVTVEGIEDKATTELLVTMGCKEGQGYYFSRPIPAGEFEQKFLSKDYEGIVEPFLATQETATAA